MYLAYEDVLLSFVPKSRRGNQYCTPLGVDYHIKEIATASTLGQLEKIWYRVRTQKDSDKRKSIGKDKTRYRNINMHTFFSDGHIEIRLHSGTINPDKIKHWTALHTAIVDYAVKEMYSLNGAITAFSEIDLSKKTTDLLEKIKVEKSTKDYFISRQKELQDNSLIIN